MFSVLPDVSMLKRTLGGIRGAVGELITTEDTYAIAIETALGAAAQNIVVETQEDGARAIELLKRRDMGRCTFLPMNVITGSEPGMIPQDDKGFVGVACLFLQQVQKAFGILKCCCLHP